MQKEFLEYRPLPTVKRRYVFKVGETSVPLTLVANEQGLVACRIGDSEVLHENELEETGPQIAWRLLEEAAEQLTEYFEGRRLRFELTLMPEGTDFQRQVWQATRQIPYGQVRSYWWVAVRMGNPYAVRAVGGALKVNPLAIFVPCHRVVKQDGGLGGFRPGIEWKELLLEHEERHKDKLYETQWSSQQR